MFSQDAAEFPRIAYPFQVINLVLRIAIRGRHSLPLFRFRIAAATVADEPLHRRHRAYDLPADDRVGFGLAWQRHQRRDLAAQ